MATQGRNRGEEARSNLEQEAGAVEQIKHGAPALNEAAPQEQAPVEPIAPAAPESAGSTDAAAIAAAAKAEAKARAEAEASAQRQAKDRKIAEDAKEAQRSREMPRNQTAATTAPTGKFTVHNEDHNGVQGNFGLFDSAEEAEIAMNDMANSFDQNGVGTWRVEKIDPNALDSVYDYVGPTSNESSNKSAASTAVNNATGKKQWGKQKNIPKHPVQPQQQQRQQQQQQQQQARQQQNQAAPAPNAQASAAAPSSTGNTEETPSLHELIKSMFYSRSRQARAKNKSLYRQYHSERRKNPDLTAEEFFAEHPLDEEAFYNTPGSAKREHYRSNAEYEADRVLREEGQYSDTRGKTERGVKVKDTYKQDRLEDQTVWDMKIGFFPVQSMKIVKDEETGEYHFEWSLRVEDAMNTIMEDCNLTGIDGQRTVFRMVRLYASMAIDRQGKMFNGDANEWELTDQEFSDICECMHRSILLFGHPFVAPIFLFETKSGRKDLRGTDMYPSGYIPDVVAKAITGEGSDIRFPEGHPRAGQQMTAQELQTECKNTWINMTQPVMNATLVNSNNYIKKKKQKKTKIDDGVYLVKEEEAKERNLVAQRIAVESAIRAFARVDGMGAEAFGDEYNVDTAQHYKLWEYKDGLIEYAAAMGGKYDADLVCEREKEKTRIYEEQNRKRRGRRKVNEFEASCNLLTSGIKTNALWWNLPVRLSAIAEKGVGNLQTHLTLGLLKGVFPNPERYQTPNEIVSAFQTDEGYKTIDAAYILLEIGGPRALVEFGKTSQPMTQDNVIKYLKEEFLRESSSMRSAQIQEANIKLNKFAQRILAGDCAFRKSDITNFFNALMISNQAVANAQEQFAKQHGMNDYYAGMSLTGAEMLDVFKANNNDVSRFLSEVMTTSAGKDALMMMKANNIAQFNVVSHSVNSLLRDHGIGNALITSFVDSFATYGINFLYAMLPASRTITYLGIKLKESGGDIMISDFAIGGGIGDGAKFDGKMTPGFWNGLVINVMFDAMTMGKWVCGGILIGGVMMLLGMEPPDDPEDVINISKWKIGKNLGLGPDTNGDGKGDGIEIAEAYWLNDLTQWGLPIGYLTALAMTLPEDTNINGMNKLSILTGTLTDSIAGQFDGNVVLDFADCILNWGDDMIDIQKTIDDPTHEMTHSPLFGVSELCLRAFGKIVPGAPLYRAWGTSAALRGPNARMYSTNKKFDKSEEWTRQVGKTDYIDDPVERLIRKYSSGNWLLAAFMDLGNMLSVDPSKTTGYAWWEMPIRTKTEPFALALAEEQKMDYDHLEEGETVASYNAKRTDDLRKMIAERGYESPEEAIRDGFFITHDIRKAALDTTFSELNALKNEYDMKCEEQFETKEDFYAYKSNYDEQKAELWSFINNWLKNEDIPTWIDNYEQLLSDWDVTYVKADGTPATIVDRYYDRIFNQGQGVKEQWELKGNHPTSMLPFTWVDYSSNDEVQRSFSGETVPGWLNKDSSLTSRANLKALGDKIIQYGKDAGLTVNDVYYGKEYNGKRLHENDETINARGWVPEKTKLPDDIKNFGEKDASGGIYGDAGKSNKTDTSNNDNDGDKPWKSYDDKKPWKTSSSGGSSFYSRKSYRGKSGSYDYNPKIYSNPRQVNADKAATMYTKTPQSAKNTYLRPNFQTKGSREAYERQDF